MALLETSLLVDRDDFTGELKEVTSRKIFKNVAGDKILFHPEGLYSEQIFGPVQDFVCQCPPGDYSIIRRVGEVCPKCGVEITTSLKRRRTFAKITLPFPAVSGAFYVLLKSLRNNVFLRIFENLITKDYLAIVFNLETGKVEEEIDKMNIEKLKEYELKMDENLVLIRDVYKLIETMTLHYERLYEKSLEKIVKEELILNPKIHKLLELIMKNQHFVNYVLVLPPAYRPILLGQGGGSSSNIVLDETTKAYIRILNEKSLLEKCQNILSSEKMRAGYVNSLNAAVVNLYTAIINSMRGKEGLLRSLLKRRVDWSMRGVIVPISGDTNMVYAPRNGLLEVLKIDVAGKILEKDKKRSFIEVIELIDRVKSGKKVDKEDLKLVLESLEEVAEDSMFIINRQPTLHRGSMWAVKVKPWNQPVIGLPKLLCEPLNADFDGDTVALYRVILNKDLVRLKMSPSSKTATINPQDLSSYLKAKQDIIYSLYLISKNPESEYYKRLEAVVGKTILDKYKPLNKSKLSRLFTEIHSTSLFNKILEIADEFTYNYPITMSIIDFEIPQVNNILESDIEKEELVNNIEQICKKEFTLADVINSGARGSFSQVRQIVGVRGFVSDIYGRVYPKFVSGNYAKGLTPEELYISAKGTRKALLDQDITIAKSGYLYRKLVYNSSFVNLSNIQSCNHYRFFEFNIPDDEKLSEIFVKGLLNRKLYMDDAILEVNHNNISSIAKEIKGKRIKIFSPITCDLEVGICKDCYPLDFGSSYIGFIAAQSVSERLTQTSLRTFHTGGIAKGSENREDVVNILDVMNKYFDSTRNYANFDEMISDMISHWLYIADFGVQLIHMEVINSARLFVEKDGEEMHIKEFIRRYQNENPDSIILYSVSKIPYMRSKTLGLIFEDAVMALANMLLSDKRDESIFDRLFLESLV